MTLDPLNPAFGILALGVALATAYLASRWLQVETSGRNLPLDGLRGYMAFGVFIYHSVVWYYYLRTGEWGPPPASVYRPVGDLCVKVFFMITAYLFVGKVIDAKRRPIDWLALYVSRVLRLTPLYLFSVVMLVTMTFALSGWKLQEPFGELLDQVGRWVAFTVISMPDVNRLPNTWRLIAGVTWTLSYEWLFYLSLPLVALVMRRRVPVATLLACTALMGWLLALKPNTFMPWSFVAGAVAATVAREPRIANRLCGRGVSILVVVAIAWALLAEGLGQTKASSFIALVLGFIPVACGNPVFGTLTNRPALLLGEVSYGLYLLHGLLLSFTFNLLLGNPVVKTLSATQHWFLVMLVGTVLVVVACMTFRWIERPAMRSARQWTLRLNPARY